MKNRYLAWWVLLVIAGLAYPLLGQETGVPGEKTVQPNLPPTAVRTMAEWEEVEALVIAWRSYRPF
ncbi:MAG: hypothetical protein R2795_06325 [Saprospiraceae bacterium]